MGYVNTAFRKKTTPIKIQVGKKIIEAEVCSLPFVEI